MEQERKKALTKREACFIESAKNLESWSYPCAEIRSQALAMSAWYAIGPAGNFTYLRSRSCMPVTLFCAYVTISLNRYAKLARLSSAVRVRLRFRS